MNYVNYGSAWRINTLALGVILLIVGSVVHPAPDWDIGISLLMAGLTYLLAPWVIGVIWYRQWSMLPAAMMATWFTVDGIYCAYWYAFNPKALELMRDANWLPSLCLFLICGLVWLRKGGE